RTDRTDDETRLRASTVREIVMPGAVTSHHALKMYSLPMETSSPHDVCGGWMPNPRKDRAASTRMTVANSRRASVSRGDTMLGRMCRLRIRQVEAPAASAAATYCDWLTDSTADRIVR